MVEPGDKSGASGNILENFLLSDNDGPEAKEEMSSFNTLNIVACQFCERRIPENKLQQHQDYYCQSRMLECPTCNDLYPLEMIEDHIPLCA